MPKRLGATYIDEDSQRKTPVMLHRAILGSLERFVGILLEEYAGDLPLWMAPVQAVILNISENQANHCEELADELNSANIRCSVDSRNEKLGAKIISKIENINQTIKKLNLKTADKKKYYSKSFELGIPQIDLNKLKEKIFGIENNLDELNGIDFKKGCYVGQENTSRIKLRNKLRRRIMPIKKISGEIRENDIIKFNNSEIGKIMIDKPYSFALIKVVDPDLNEFDNAELTCGSSKVKILKPEWV